MRLVITITGLFYVPVKYYRALPVITHLLSYHKYL
jgi:hypothetical protein